VRLALLTTTLALAGCATLGEIFGSDPDSAASALQGAQQTIREVGGLFGVSGEIIAGGVSTMLLAAYAVWSKATEKSRHAKHSRAATT